MELQPIPNYGELIEIEQFMYYVQQKSITAGDGVGFYGKKDGFYKEHQFRFIRFADHPSWATHVMWFNH